MSPQDPILFPNGDFDFFKWSLAQHAVGEAIPI